MDVKMENLFFGWHEKLPETFIKLVNTLVLTRNGKEVREAMATLAQDKDFNDFSSTDWTQAFVGQAKRCTHHLWKYGLQTFDC